MMAGRSRFCFYFVFFCGATVLGKILNTFELLYMYSNHSLVSIVFTHLLYYSIICIVLVTVYSKQAVFPCRDVSRVRHCILGFILLLDVENIERRV